MLYTEKRLPNNARILWNYLSSGETHKDQHADFVIGLGGDDINIALHCIDLYVSGITKKIVFTGGIGNSQLRHSSVPRAEWFFEEALSRGVPKRDILTSSEGFSFRDSLFQAKDIIKNEETLAPSPRIIIVHKPYTLRMLYNMCTREWSHCWMNVSQISADCDEYIAMQKEGGYVYELASLLVSHFRIYVDYMLHHNLGTIHDIPESVRLAFYELKDMGYTKYLKPQNPNYPYKLTFGL